ncbi:hypothetical protein HYH02_006676 [Chlamydomonas schloesseri]|uniref:Uncharacterized protein n=1 Tax=Chlamydomonas schloesseri TaxID=2026947 RepID=A0A835SWB3_9CHLO|nr:hypothetical protein HYH02_006676 [Chlamydomonas schloesseri]|eukprot:KAG2432692.1 hypothetical protein HYH02_006676 [Chlamydomonas schloesseri]
MHALPGTNGRVAVGNVVVPGETVEMKLARAKGYPYPRPDTSFLFINGNGSGGAPANGEQGQQGGGGGDVFLFDNEQWRGQQDLPHIRGRCGALASDFASARGVDLSQLAGQRMWPVLAIGSNAGPEQLRRKYPVEAFPGAVIPVVQIQLHGFDVAYTPYLASYGSCTATLEASLGTCVTIFITYLTEPLMERMHATEGGYNLTRLTGLNVAVAPHTAADSSNGNGHHDHHHHQQQQHPQNSDARSSGPAAGKAGTGSAPAAGAFEHIHTVYQYNHKLGCLDLPLTIRSAGQDGGGTECSPVAIAEIPAVGRAFPAATQPQMLAALRESLGMRGGSSSNSSSSSSSIGNGNGGGVAAPLQPVNLEAAGLVEAQEGLDEWILRMVRDDRLRQAVCARLAAHAARPFTYPQSEVMVTL